MNAALPAMSDPAIAPAWLAASALGLSSSERSEHELIGGRLAARSRAGP